MEQLLKTIQPKCGRLRCSSVSSVLYQVLSQKILGAQSIVSVSWHKTVTPSHFVFRLVRNLSFPRKHMLSGSLKTTIQFEIVSYKRCHHITINFAESSALCKEIMKGSKVLTFKNHYQYSHRHKKCVCVAILRLVASPCAPKSAVNE